MDIGKIIDRVRKLNAKAESAKELGSEAEAQAFADAVQRMLAEYPTQWRGRDGGWLRSTNQSPGTETRWGASVE